MKPSSVALWSRACCTPLPVLSGLLLVHGFIPAEPACGAVCTDVAHCDLFSGALCRGVRPPGCRQHPWSHRHTETEAPPGWSTRASQVPGLWRLRQPEPERHTGQLHQQRWGAVPAGCGAAACHEDSTGGDSGPRSDGEGASSGIQCSGVVGLVGSRVEELWDIIVLEVCVGVGEHVCWWWFCYQMR